ncbi:MAG: hypothetical protein H7177_00675 [Rhizobacter sp.]|nr:hypothetical protein [Bacteriovorax sp.]
MKSHQKLLINIGALIIVAVIGAFLFKNYRPPVATVNHGSTTSVEKANPDVILSKTPAEAVTTHSNTSPKEENCKSLRSTYMNIDEVKKVEKVDVRFVNTHKKVDGIVYRLRLFYKDTSENDYINYLVYKENQNDEDILVEKSPYKKGKLYTKIEKALGEILYSEEGINIGTEQDLFLHYENKVLKDLQGVSPNPREKDYIECRF